VVISSFKTLHSKGRMSRRLRFLISYNGNTKTWNCRGWREHLFLRYPCVIFNLLNGLKNCLRVESCHYRMTSCRPKSWSFNVPRNIYEKDLREGPQMLTVLHDNQIRCQQKITRKYSPLKSKFFFSTTDRSSVQYQHKLYFKLLTKSLKNSEIKLSTCLHLCVRRRAAFKLEMTR